ncbi:hypothetical protein OG596_17170 [Streptomyces sp. NBC_01102]|uniref:hypothetical protein n=1 Tax=unclassified Streptomyces TaxID=2593676 RepID=UPI00386DBC49|nr:hypothetical protein OG596_17170 [Streptomyces sp. NBC_01102]
MATLSAPNAQDCVALAEIELCGELMIAASAAMEDRLSPDRIDEVLDVRAVARGIRDEPHDRPGIRASCDTHDISGTRSRRDVPDTGADREGRGGHDERGACDERGERAARIPRQCNHRG